jgi:hypothetical protein
MTKRAFQHVVEAGLLPPDGDIRTLKRIATIGGFAAAGVPLLCSAKIAAAILVEFNEGDGEAPSGLKFLVRELLSDEISGLPAEAPPNDYWYHLGLLKHRQSFGLSGSGGSTHFDVFIEIVDRKFVFIRSTSDLKTLDSVTQNPQEAQFVGWLEGWERGSDTRLVHLYEKIQVNICDTEDTRPKTASDVVAEASDARSNAVGAITINVSLAIRRALDRVAEHRAMRQPNTNTA